MKSFVPFLPMLAVLAVPLALPQVVRPAPRQSVTPALAPSLPLLIHIMTAEEAEVSDPFALITNNDKISVNIPRAQRYIYAHCSEDHHDGDGNTCAVARVIVHMAGRDYEVLP